MSPAHGHSAAFVGRSRELLEVVARSNAARAGRAQVVLVVGEAGIGKTELIRHSLAPLSNATIWPVSGDVDEQGLDLALAAQLLDVVTERPSGGATAGEPSATGRELLAAMSDHAAPTGTFLVVEDLHWIDSASLQALAFACRRLRHEPVLVLLTCRPDGLERVPEGLRRLASGPDGTTVELTGLTRDAVRSLAEELGHPAISTRAAERIRQHTDGNPLHVRMLLAETSTEVLNDPRDRPLPAPTSVAEQVERRLDDLPGPTRHVLEAAAVLQAQVPLALLAEVAEIDDALGVLDAARERGLVEVTDAGAGPTLSFVHPLIRSATYEAMPLSERARLHRCAADAGDGRAALRHRIAATVGYDDELALELIARAQADAGASAWTMTANGLLSASHLLSDPAARAATRSHALGVLLIAGDVLAARQVAAQLHDEPPTALRDLVLGALAIAEQRWLDAVDRLEAAWAMRADADQETTARIAEQMTSASLQLGRLDEAIEWGHRALEFADPDAERRGFGPLASLLLAYARAGRAADGLALLDERPELLVEIDDGVVAGQFGRGVLRLYTDDVGRAIDDLAPVARRARTKGPMFVWCAAETYLAAALLTVGRLDDAHAATLRALGAGDYPMLRCVAHSAASIILTMQGESEAADEALADGEHELELAGNVATARHAIDLARAYRALFDGEPGDVAELLGDHRADELTDLHSQQPLARSLAEDLVLAGRWDQADRQIGRLEAMVERLSTGNQAIVTALRAVVAWRTDDRSRATALFERACSLARDELLIDRGHVELLRGQALLGADGDAAEGRASIRAARARFARVGAWGWVERCDRELDQADHRPSGAVSGLDALTPTERVVARLVSDGMSNREVAEELVVSVRTVESHLSRIYAKVGVSNRTQLALEVTTGRPVS